MTERDFDQFELFTLLGDTRVVMDAAQERLVKPARAKNREDKRSELGQQKTGFASPKWGAKAKAVRLRTYRGQSQPKAPRRQ